MTGCRKQTPSITVFSNDAALGEPCPYLQYSRHQQRIIKRHHHGHDAGDQLVTLERRTKRQRREPDCRDGDVQGQNFIYDSRRPRQSQDLSLKPTADEVETVV